MKGIESRIEALEADGEARGMGADVRAYIERMAKDWPPPPAGVPLPHDLPGLVAYLDAVRDAKASGA